MPVSEMEKTEIETVPAKAEVGANVDGELIWARRHEQGCPGDTARRDPAMLREVVALLSEALQRAQGELHLMTRNE